VLISFAHLKNVCRFWNLCLGCVCHHPGTNKQAFWECWITAASCIL
jgi:hypothetical protein